jgi:hypothetical protein
MNSLEILPYAAPVLFAAAVSVTAWLSYRRIIHKYPTITAEQPRNYKPPKLNNSKRPA